MGSNQNPILFPVIFFVGFLSLISSTSSASDPTYTYFLQCLQNNTDQSTAAAISTILVPKSSSQYATVLDAYLRNLRFTTSSTPKPLLIITPRTPPEVSAAVVCAAAHGTQLRIRSGGHDYEGLSYTSAFANSQFVILDLFNFRQVRVDAAKKTAYVQAGSTLGELYYSIWNQSKTLGFPAGVCPTVGVGGHVSGGGYGNMLRRYGLSVDHLVDAEIVVADGRVLDRKSMGEDLFWAISGGGGASFGVILSFTVNLVPVPETVTVFNVQRAQSANTTELVYKWQSVMQSVDPNLFIRLLLQPVTDKSKKGGGKTVRVTFIALFLGDSKTLVSTLNAAFPELGIKNSDCTELGWAESVLYWDNYPTGTPVQQLLNRTYTSNYLKRKSDYVQTPITKSALKLLWKKMAELGKPGLVFNSYGGVMNQIAADATPFPHRAGNLYKIQYSANWDVAGAAMEQQHIAEIRELYSFMEPYVSRNPRATFLNYRDLDIGVNKNGTFAEGKVYGEKYFVGNFQRLVKDEEDAMKLHSDGPMTRARARAMERATQSLVSRAYASDTGSSNPKWVLLVTYEGLGGAPS